MRTRDPSNDSRLLNESLESMHRTSSVNNVQINESPGSCLLKPLRVSCYREMLLDMHNIEKRRCTIILQKIIHNFL